MKSNKSASKDMLFKFFASTEEEKLKKHKKYTNQNDKSDFMSYKIKFLDIAQANFYLSISKNQNGAKLFETICDELGGLIERNYFGLRYKDKHNHRQWLDLDRDVESQLSCAWSNTLYFRVKHYPRNPSEDLQQEISRYLLYLQIRRDLNQGRLVCSLKDAAYLGALVLQAEFGDDTDAGRLNGLLGNANTECEENKQLNASLSIPGANEQIQTGTYDEEVFPVAKMKIFYEQSADLESEILNEHEKLRGLTTREAELALLKKASYLDTYGVDPFPVKIMHQNSQLSTLSVLDCSPKLKTEKFGKSTTYESTSDVSYKPRSFQSIDTSRSDAIGNLYLGLRHDGIGIFNHWNLTETITWSRILRLATVDRNFIVYTSKLKDSSTKSNSWASLACLTRCHTESTSAKKNAGPEKLVFLCEDKASAVALWKWTIDRMGFFKHTSKSGNGARKSISTRGSFSRSQSHNFRRKSQPQLLAPLRNSVETAPQCNFGRVSSLRRSCRRSLSTDNSPSLLKSTSYMESAVPTDEITYHRSDVTKILVDGSIKADLVPNSQNPMQNMDGSLQFSINDDDSRICPIINQIVELSPEFNFLDDQGLSTKHRHSSSSAAAVTMGSLNKSDECPTSDGDLHGEINDPQKKTGKLPKIHFLAFEIGALLLAICCFVVLIVALDSQPRTKKCELWSKIVARFHGQPAVSSFSSYIYNPIRGKFMHHFENFAVHFKK